jgi:hypothetical protein
MAHNVNLSWTKSSDAVDGYFVFHGTAAGAESATALNSTIITGTTFDDTVAAAAGPNFYFVKSSLAGILSAPGNEVSVSLPPAPPTALVIVSDN